MNDSNNPKFELVQYVFGPLLEFLRTKNIFGGWVALFLYVGVLYFFIFRKRDSSAKLRLIDKVQIAIGGIILFACLFGQVAIVMKLGK